MRIKDLIVPGSFFVSLEFFPPKQKESWPGFFAVAERLRALDPMFVSVTYGAGGSTQENTLEIVTRLKQDLDLEPLAHLTCVGASRENLHGFLDRVTAAGVDNVLALRGDPPQGESTFVPDSDEFQHASDLVSFIRTHYPELGIGVAGYPEGHVEAVSPERDLEHLKHKLDLGGEFVISQLFFDNRLYFDFVERARSIGITAPIIPGVLPAMSLKGVLRMSELGGSSLPGDLLAELEQAEQQGGSDAVSRVGIRHATEQVRGLFENGAPGVHLYTLNRAEACMEIVETSGITRERTGGSHAG
ncbi:MAG: methylenetetrahydrofolate reductase [NAD(P)H] [Desulfohalobiaceae bacterium]